MTHLVKVFIISSKKRVKRSKKMVLLLNYFKSKVEKANCSKSKLVEDN